MQGDIDVFVGNYTLIDPEIYEQWLAGKTAQDASKQLMYDKLLLNDDSEMLTSCVHDQYRLFQMIERLLYYPLKLSEQWTFQVSPDTQKLLIERYYEFDSCVVREFLGKKLSSRHRKDLDEVSEKTNIPIKSCRRQFDNVKRVYKAVEDSVGDLVQIIHSVFLLSDILARKYAAIMYITNNRFETNKRKLQYLSFDDFLHCADQMMLNWSCLKPDCQYEETAMELDREFLQELRDTKVLLDKDVFDELKLNTMNALRTNPSERILPEFETNFKIISRTLVSIASGLNHSKEVKDLFLDIVEKIIEPCRHSRWSNKDLQNFLELYISAAGRLSVFRRWQLEPPLIASFFVEARTSPEWIAFSVSYQSHSLPTWSQKLLDLASPENDIS